MITLITVLIVLACVVLAFFVLVQSPKGGGLTGNFGTLSTQVMGVKQSSDIMERGTWTAMGIIATLCIATMIFVTRPLATETAPNSKQKASKSAPAAAPATGATQQSTPAAPAPGKK